MVRNQVDSQPYRRFLDGPLLVFMIAFAPAVLMQMIGWIISLIKNSYALEGWFLFG
jgi:hypothetical protein